MARKSINRRSDGTRLIYGDRGVNPKLGAKLSVDGKSESLYLEFYIPGKGKRVRKTLKGLRLIANPINSIERAANDNVKRAAMIEQTNAANKLLSERGYMVETKAIPVDICTLVSEINTKNKVQRAATKALKGFALEAYPHTSGQLVSTSIPTDIADRFVEWLDGCYSGGTSTIYLAAIKNALNTLKARGVIKCNPFEGARSKQKQRTTIEKAVLSVEEIEKLAATRFDGENMEIRKAFLFTCLTGVRFCDVYRLTWENIDLPNRRFTFVQKKVENKSSKARVTQILSDNVVNLIGERGDKPKEAALFTLPSFNTCCKYLSRWCKKADIEKHITWHCGRHSFATISLEKGAALNVVSAVLGHSSTQITSVYLHTADKQKAALALSMDSINIGGDRDE